MADLLLAVQAEDLHSDLSGGSALLERRETDARNLEDRLASLESSLVRKEADLSAFAELLQQSLSRMENAGATSEAGDPLVPATDHS